MMRRPTMLSIFAFCRLDDLTKSRRNKVKCLLLLALLSMALLMPVLLWPVPAANAAEFPGKTSPPALPCDQQSFEGWLTAAGRPAQSRYHGYRANYSIFCQSQLLVYGEPAIIPGNQLDDATEQYAFLGYSYDEIEVANPLYCDSQTSGALQSTPWEWTELDMGSAARVSWARLSDAEKNDIKSLRLTCQNNSFGCMTFNQLHFTENTTVVLCSPSWHMGFMLLTSHMESSSANPVHASFNGPGAGQVSVVSKITMQTYPTIDGCYVIDSSSDHIDINYTISGQITTFQGMAKESDIECRGAGNTAGISSGTGIGPWSKPLTFSVCLKDLDSLPERQFTLKGQAWVVSKLGDIELSQTEKVITVRNQTASWPFAVNMDIRGNIRYFSGQTNLLGQTMPLDPHRFLAGERMKVILDFSRDPLNIQLFFNGETRKVTSVFGKKHYEISVLIPVIPSTLAFDGKRLSTPMAIKVRANARSAPGIYTENSIRDIEITGNVFNITYAQISPT